MYTMQHHDIVVKWLLRAITAQQTPIKLFHSEPKITSRNEGTCSEQRACALLLPHVLSSARTRSVLLVFRSAFCWMKCRGSEIQNRCRIRKNSLSLSFSHSRAAKILLRLSKLCVQEGASGKKSKKQQQRLLRNMGAHAVVLELLQIPYEKVRFPMRRFCCQKSVVRIMSIRMWSDLLLIRCSKTCSKRWGVS